MLYLSNPFHGKVGIIFMIESSKKGDYLEIRIPEKWSHLTIDELLRNYWKAPKKLVHEWRMNKDLFLNGKEVYWNTTLQKEDKLLLPVFKGDFSLIEPTYLDISILYEDEHLLIINKPAGIETHPSQDGETNSLTNAVSFHLVTNGEKAELRHIHRLDKDTTGAILFSKNALAGAMLNRMLEEREIKRSYRALVHGKLKKKKGKITASIGRDRHHATRRRVSPSGQHAVTNYEMLQYYPKTNLSLIQCQLETGRTHQIRVHLSDIGHPLAGDTLYGGQSLFQRQALHAYRIQFIHPILEERIDIEAPYIDYPPIFPSL